MKQDGLSPRKLQRPHQFYSIVADSRVYAARKLSVRPNSRPYCLRSTLALLSTMERTPALDHHFLATLSLQTGSSSASNYLLDLVSHPGLT